MVQSDDLYICTAVLLHVSLCVGMSPYGYCLSVCVLSLGKQINDQAGGPET